MVFFSLACVLSGCSRHDLTTLRIEWGLLALVAFDGDVFLLVFESLCFFLNLFLLESFLLDPLDVGLERDQWQKEECEEAENQAHKLKFVVV